MRPPPATRPPANLLWFDEVDSTNRTAARLLTAWADEDDPGRLADTVVVAGRQSAGRGRGANSWVSPRGGLYASWVGWLPISALDAVPLAAAVSLAGAVEGLVPGLKVGLKWPNDLHAGDGKLGGILCQSRVAGDGAWVIVGVGVNIDTAPELGRDGGARASCLAGLGWAGECGDACGRLVAEFVGALRPALADPAGTLAAWARRSVHVDGELMLVRVGDETARGRFAGFGPRGELRLELDGAVRTIAAGALVAALEP
ncbi:MAG: biotin-(acetyl-CoA carboxylase) ligase [Acidobacteria bacterium]|jgi:BirA family biotin operon repressor/biotin-[acetyl-CoA-carboxylase] ligase|nr:biotin-(acetyl-CoA carboxylase) ligase [Acidobacteriota bacterium]